MGFLLGLFLLQELGCGAGRRPRVAEKWGLKKCTNIRECNTGLHMDTNYGKATQTILFGESHSKLNTSFYLAAIYML